jgi:two-component system, LytTR family, sensor kinase
MDRFFKYKLDHILFWMFTVFFHGYTRLYIIDRAGFGEFAFEVILRNGLLAIVVYVTLLVIIPRLSARRNVALSCVLLFASLIFYVLIKSFHDVYLNAFVMGETSDFLRNVLYNSSIVLFYLSFATALHLSKQWSLQRALIRKIELEKLNTELQYLKAQINPHFLFNSINTIFFQIEKQNTSARETLSKFSDMLRYQLYECNGHEISVEKEIGYLKNYVELQRLRKDENYSIEFSSSAEMVNFTLPPLLLVPFVENAFKHVSHFTDKKNEIKIELSKAGNFFRFSVFNTKDNTQRAAENGGIGLKNVKRRLELSYQDKYLLDIQDTPEHFTVNLELHVS